MQKVSVYTRGEYMNLWMTIEEASAEPVVKHIRVGGNGAAESGYPQNA